MEIPHPNYLGEVSFWFGIYIFALASGSTPCGISLSISDVSPYFMSYDGQQKS